MLRACEKERWAAQGFLGSDIDNWVEEQVHGTIMNKSTWTYWIKFMSIIMVVYGWMYESKILEQSGLKLIAWDGGWTYVIAQGECECKNETPDNTNVFQNGRREFSKGCDHHRDKSAGVWEDRNIMGFRDVVANFNEWYQDSQ